MQKSHKFALILSFLIVVSFVFIGLHKSAKTVKSQTTHVVISEIQTRGNGGANDEFVELYNPNGNPADITGWSLARISAGSDSESNFVTPISEGTIPAHGYFLIARSSVSTPGFNGSVTSDLTYGSSLADNTTILLYDNSEPKQLVDKVGLGENTLPESSPAPQLQAEDPPADRSVERVGEDTNNNSVDFVLQQNPNPQNTTFTPIPTPTEVVTPIPTNEPTPIPTEVPTVIPTEVPTVTPIPTTTPTPEPTPTEIIIGYLGIGKNAKVCTLKYKIVGSGFFRFLMPTIKCVKAVSQTVPSF